MIQVEKPILSIHPESYSPFQIRSRISRPRSVDWSCPSVDWSNSLLKNLSTALFISRLPKLSVENSVDCTVHQSTTQTLCLKISRLHCVISRLVNYLLKNQSTVLFISRLVCSHNLYSFYSLASRLVSSSRTPLIIFPRHKLFLKDRKLENNVIID